MGNHGRLNNEIRDSGSSSFCKFCSKNVVYGDNAEAPFQERQGLIAIGNSLKEVENMTMFLQRMSSWQEMDRNAAFTSLEDSRVNLLAKVTEYKGRELDVVTELKACFRNESNVPFNWDFKERLKKKKAETGAQHRRFLTKCIAKLLILRKWQKEKVGFAAKLVMVSASVFSIMAAFHSRQLIHTNSRKMMIPFLVSSEGGQSGSLLTISKSPLDVFCGRG